MLVQLKKGTEIIPAFEVIYKDPTAIFPRFDLKGMPLGKYDVILQKNNGDIASLEEGFTVEIDKPGLPDDVNDPGGGGTNCLITGISELDESLEITYDFPLNIRPRRHFLINVHYRNRGNIDLDVPRLVMSSLSSAPLGNSFTNLLKDMFFEFTLNFIDPGGPKGILRPGAGGKIPVHSYGDGSENPIKYTVKSR